MATNTEGPGVFARLFRNLFWLMAVLFIIFGISSAYTIITPGNVGVVFNRINGSLRTIPQGIAWRIPFMTTVKNYPVALRTYTMVKRSIEGSDVADDSIDLPTLEGQHIRQDISVTYNTDETKAAQVFQSFRGADIEEIENTFIRRTIITAAQNVAGQMSLTEIIASKRNQFQDSVQKDLLEEFDKMGFIVDKVNLGASHLPETLEDQLQQKMAAQQQAQQAEYELQRQQLLAKAQVAKAEGEAQSTLVRAKADAEAYQLMQSSLTPNVVQKLAVEKWNGILPQITGGATPIIDMRSLGLQDMLEKDKR